MNTDKIREKIDYTILHPNATYGDIEEFIKNAINYGFLRVFISQFYVPLAVKLLKGTGIAVGSVVGFPFGSSLPCIKSFECEKVIGAGAKEIDMVINIAALKNGDLTTVRRDIKSVVSAAKRNGIGVKAIIETCYLTDEEKITACKAAVETGVKFVKTSTGYGPKGATIEDVKLMRDVVGDKIGVKASGGIRTAKDAIALIKAGADRIGTSSGPAIINEARKLL
jgi:deoxyribose-phosphate aldolase